MIGARAQACNRSPYSSGAVELIAPVAKHYYEMFDRRVCYHSGKMARKTRMLCWHNGDLLKKEKENTTLSSFPRERLSEF